MKTVDDIFIVSYVGVMVIIIIMIKSVTYEEIA